jgi:cytochrome c-type protein NapB
MEKPDQKIGKIAIGFAVICLLVVAGIVGTYLIGDDDQQIAEQSGLLAAATSGFDEKGASHFQRFKVTSDAYMAGTASDRNLAEYYSRRQYLGSPPFIPHPINQQFGARKDCLSCHENGGFTQKWNRNAPVTPHPEMEMCRQCHMSKNAHNQFVAHDWKSIRPPRLGRSQLPGSPPPFPHPLQMRGNCIACHVGPGAVTEIRVEHPSRGVCRQCHMPEAANIKPFDRDSL